MAKAQVAAAAPARFMTEVAPPPVVSVMRRSKVPMVLDTIAEDDRELQLASPLDYSFAAAWTTSLKRMPTPTPQHAGGFMTRDVVGNYFSDAHGCQASGWEGGHKVGLRRAVHAQELHKVGA